MTKIAMGSFPTPQLVGLQRAVLHLCALPCREETIWYSILQSEFLDSYFPNHEVLRFASFLAFCCRIPVSKYVSRGGDDVQSRYLVGKTYPLFFAIPICPFRYY